MTQPPDDRPRPPDEPEGQAAPDEPTVAWTPPGGEPDKPAEAGGAGWAAVGDEAAPTEPPAAAGPIISATTAGTPPESAEPGTPEATLAAAGWQQPAAAAALPQREGYAIAGVGARFVAWLIDLLLVGIIPAALSLILVRLVVDHPRRASGRRSSRPIGWISSFTYEVPITLDYILLTLIGLGIQYLYFVGFWTSGLRATPGMIGLKMRVVDVGTGGALSIVEATKRWVVMGWPLTLLVLIPALQGFASLIQFAVVLILFFTTVLDDRSQGLHDKVANSLVIRSVTSGAGATVVGCLVWCVLVILLGIIVSAVRAGRRHARDPGVHPRDAPKHGVSVADRGLVDSAQRDGLPDMDPAAFRAAAHAVVDLMADYLATVEHARGLPADRAGVAATGVPGRRRRRQPEPLEAILADYERLVEPNATHWQHPGFLAYFATTASGPGSWARC